MYDFDKILNRRNTDCVKHDLNTTLFGREDVLPMWVADMDFETPDFIIDAIRKRLDHPILGYSFRGVDYHEAVISWLKRRQNWTVEREWLAYAPGIVPALNLSVLAYTRPGDRIIVQPPVYHPFFGAVKDHDRDLAYNPLVRDEAGKYFIDFEGLEAKCREGAKALILCSPHNPVGRVWSREELSQTAEICLRHDVLILSDEIHGDLILPGNTFIPLASISEAIAARTVTYTAASKTFNLAGLSTATMIIPDELLRKQYTDVLGKMHLNMGNIPGNVATLAAYREGDVWLDSLLEYIQGNVDFVSQFLQERIPEVKMVPPEATYLLWLNFEELGMDADALKDFIINRARLGLNQGITFGSGGESYMRMNVACPRKTVEEAMEQLYRAVTSHRA